MCSLVALPAAAFQHLKNSRLFLQAAFGNARNSQETLYVPLLFRRVCLLLALSERHNL
jgi:hypothetical protein